jgi:hypothetical protein
MTDAAPIVPVGRPQVGAFGEHLARAGYPAGTAEMTLRILTEVAQQAALVMMPALVADAERVSKRRSAWLTNKLYSLRTFGGYVRVDDVVNAVRLAFHLTPEELNSL